ncbi:hypothetical protein CKJ90_29450 [Klebsiella pneumoniae]|nr:hypothetical protein CKJ90_29450 [Klebsiella pneumoniae]
MPRDPERMAQAGLIDRKTILTARSPGLLKSHFERAPFADVDPRRLHRSIRPAGKNQGSAK